MNPQDQAQIWIQRRDALLESAAASNFPVSMVDHLTLDEPLKSAVSQLLAQEPPPQ